MGCETAHGWPRKALTACVLAVCLLAMPLAALELEGSAEVGAAYSDNIALAPDDEESEWAAIAALSARVEHMTSQTFLQGTGVLEYRDYQNGVFDDELLLALSGSGRHELVPERYFWHVEDYFRQAAIDPLAAPNPANRQNINALSTGPEGRWRITPRHSLTAGARYSNFYFEESDTDSHRYSGYSEWLFDVSPRTDLSAHAEVTQVDYFDSPRDENYVRAEAFLRLLRNYPRAELELDGGRSTVQRDVYDDLYGYLYRLGWRLNLNSSQRIGVSASAQYTDSGNDLLARAARGAELALVDEQLSGDVFFVRQGELVYHRDESLFGLRLAAGHRNEDFDVTDRDRAINQGSLELNVPWSASVTATFRGSHRRIDYRQIDREDRDSAAAVQLRYQWRRQLSLNLDLAHHRRESTLSEYEFKENRALLRLVYDTPRRLSMEPEHP